MLQREGAGATTGLELTRQHWSLALLVLVNLLPLLGVLLLQWDVASLVILYWSENLVIGFYTLLKMMLKSPVGGLFSSLFFSIHYGGFCAVHGLFILTMLINPDAEFLKGDHWPLFLVFIQLLLDVSRQVLAAAPPAWLVAFGGLALSHGASFVANFLVGGERERASINQLMAAPYGRIIVMHVAVLVGGFGVVALGQPLPMLLALVLLKLAVDVQLHRREHRKLRAVPASEHAVTSTT